MSSKRRVRLAAVGDVAEGEGRVIEAQGKELALFNVDGTYYAVRNVCPHHGAPLCLGDVVGTMLPSDVGQYEYGLDNLLLQCPRHNWEFDLRTGESMHAPDRYRCKVYPVKVEDGMVLVDLSSRRAAERSA